MVVTRSACRTQTEAKPRSGSASQINLAESSDAMLILHDHIAHVAWTYPPFCNGGCLGLESSAPCAVIVGGKLSVSLGWSRIFGSREMSAQRSGKREIPEQRSG